MDKITNLYIHIPFCLKKCRYCAFYSEVNCNEEIFNKYFEKLIDEFNYYYDLYEFDLKTIYFGGGTPSLIPVKLYEKFFNYLEKKKFNIQNIEELTIEVNPKVFDEKILNFFNRISIGTQSFNDKKLSYLGRLHKSEDNYILLKKLEKNNFDNVSIDIIFGLPFENRNIFQSDLEEVGKYNIIKHISCYELTYEEGTELYLEKNQKLNDDEIISFYKIKDEILKKYGFEKYEISNYSKKGYESKHNLSYWTDKYYLGLGAGAHSYINNMRWANENSIIKYINGKNKKEIDLLTQSRKESEYIFLHLRMTKGMNILEFNKKFNIDFLKKYERIIKTLKENNKIEIKDGYIRLTNEGEIISDYVFSFF